MGSQDSQKVYENFPDLFERFREPFGFGFFFDSNTCLFKKENLIFKEDKPIFRKEKPVARQELSYLVRTTCV